MTKPIIGDPLFKVKTVASTPNPQRLCWLAAHQDYSEGYVGDQEHTKSEEFYGDSVINHCVKFGHWGVLEHPSITFAVGYFPHSVLVQARTHRIGCCLSGDTILRFSTSPGETNSRKKSLKELYKLWSLGRKHQTGEKEILNARKRISSRELWQLDEDTKELSKTKIVDVFESGEKEVYNITLEDGKSLKATLDHKVFTPEGWKRFGETAPGDEVFTVSPCGKGSGSLRREIVIPEESEEWRFIPGHEHYEVSNYGRVRSWAPKKHRGVKHHPKKSRMKVQMNKNSKTGYPCVSLCTDGKMHAVHRLVALAWLPEPEPSKPHVLHLNGNPWDNRPENLVWGNDKGNALDRVRHDTLSRHRGKAVKIKSIEYVGVEMTYDLEVEGPYHNFLANWFVVHNSFDAQSMRYTSKRFLEYYENYQVGQAKDSDLEKLFYFRPCGEYSDRQGGKYTYSGYQRRTDIDSAERSLISYAKAVGSGLAEEHARDLLASGYRQHFVLTFNLRSALHFLDLRSKADAQPEIQTLSSLIFSEIENWVPEIAKYYKENRFSKARLAP